MEGTNSTLDELLSMEETSGQHAKVEAKQVRDYARNRVFAAKEVLGIINRPFGRRPVTEGDVPSEDDRDPRCARLVAT